MTFTGSSEKNLAKFSDTCSVWADGLCIGCLCYWAERGRENSNLNEFFCTTLYIKGEGFSENRTKVREIEYQNQGEWVNFFEKSAEVIYGCLPGNVPSLV